MWSVEAVSQEGSISLGSSRDPLEVSCWCLLLCINNYYAYTVMSLQARINVPAPSVRTLQREIAVSGFTYGASIQVITPCMHGSNYSSPHHIIFCNTN